MQVRCSKCAPTVRDAISIIWQCAQEISTRQCCADRHSALVQHPHLLLHLHHHCHHHHRLQHPHHHPQALEIPTPTCARCCRAIRRATRHASSPRKRQVLTKPAAPSPSTFPAPFSRSRRCRVFVAYYSASHAETFPATAGCGPGVLFGPG